MARINSKYCKGCKDRKVGCHIKCFAYNVDIARMKLAKKEERRRSFVEYNYEAYISDKMRRRRKCE